METSTNSASRSIPPSRQMMEMITGHWVTHIVRAAACYSLGDHLEHGPMTARDFATAEGLDEPATKRFLAACAALGIVKSEGDRYVTTDLLRTLRKDIPDSLRGFALSYSAQDHWLPEGRFTDALKTGERQTGATLSAEVFD